MMNLKALNTICYTIAIICIVAGIVLALVLIRGGVEQEFVWKGLLTFAVLFLGASLTLSVNKLLERRSGG